MRAIGLDVHRGFCEVAIAENGEVRPARRVGTAPVELEAFAAGLGPDDLVTLEATGNAAAIARILGAHARVVLANPKATKAATRLRAKTDRIDARTLAQLLASGFLPDVWLPDEATAALRRQVSRRAHLVKQRTKAKNQVHAALIRNLIGRPPASDLFGRRGRDWLAEVSLPADEREGVEASLRVIDFLDLEVARLDRVLAAAVLASPDMRRLMTLPGVSATTAATLAAVIGDVARFSAPGRLVAYLGLDPRVSQSGEDPARHGRISKQGAAVARQVLVEAPWVASRTTGPLDKDGHPCRWSGAARVGSACDGPRGNQAAVDRRWRGWTPSRCRSRPARSRSRAWRTRSGQPRARGPRGPGLFGHRDHDHMPAGVVDDHLEPRGGLMAARTGTPQHA
jgi:transposase